MPAKRLDHDWYSQPLPDNVALGERSWLYSSFAFSHYACRSAGGVRVGNDTGLYHGTFFDLGRDAEVIVGDYCSLVGAIIATNGRVTIGDYTFIAHEVVIADGHWASPANEQERPDAAAMSGSRSNIEIGPQCLDWSPSDHHRQRANRRRRHYRGRDARHPGRAGLHALRGKSNENCAVDSAQCKFSRAVTTDINPATQESRQPSRPDTDMTACQSIRSKNARRHRRTQIQPAGVR